ncbi:hypothetical protein J18TS1_04220 [Oceanobacillus oncorhynchi subsp. incaldanensis]|uniref:DNA-binding transcriptional repressor MngR n=1 Tax=Oceanobacillus oncorhynchi TaxID=545501 RepID=A0A0A1MXV9_9BACI|nr:GntR family transcriptional regulator [Oceanobacillus oncorhynchi]GIO17322.1 hypothetical protein J18TS1_04220 [Oceanobacillus oncorhynchi subsp. incaldanensis]CEI83631.1 DNA-binding transcriptional repressor MngR [Oceanobacillus oncorhynchi]
MKKYQFVADKILKRIEEGIYIDRLPTVRKLMEAFGVSQVTVTQALKYLVENNRIYAKVGYYIISRKEKAAAFNGVYDFSTASTSWTDFPLDSYS